MLNREALISDELLARDAKSTLNKCQKTAFDLCISEKNVFLTGAAGTGKTYLIQKVIRYFMDTGRRCSVVASTGAAAILAGGQTFHRFFGINAAKSPEVIVSEALTRPAVCSRVRSADVLILDEVSMLPGFVMDAANQIARTLRGSDLPWGGIKVLAVGDFRQLPPVAKFTAKPWAFLSPTWEESEFIPVVLKTPMRASDTGFLKILDDFRKGKLTQEVREFLISRSIKPEDDSVPRLYSRRAQVDEFNLLKLSELKGATEVFPTAYGGAGSYVDLMRKEGPISEVLLLKVGALVMLRNNDKEDRWVNGTLGLVQSIGPDIVTVKLLSGRVVEVTPFNFITSNDNGEIMASAKNFPLMLAWATTIHKSQGATMDRALIDLRALWEPGQAYVAMSRVKTPGGIYIDGWDHKGFKTDKKVDAFHLKIWNQYGDQAWQK